MMEFFDFQTNALVSVTTITFFITELQLICIQNYTVSW